MIDMGLSIGKFNLSHGNTEENVKKVKKINEIFNERSNKVLGLMLNIRGRDIRLGKFEGTLKFEKDDIIQITSDMSKTSN